MDINADFSLRVVLHGAAMAWADSPVAGVQRRMLDRIGDEVARATTIVRYAPGSRFTAHTHGGGEEFIVLDGVFQDEHGEYSPGSYIRNPPTSRHTPGSTEGCIIFVKLWQFAPKDRTHVIVDMNKMGKIGDLLRPGVAVTPLFEDERETVQLEHWEPGAQVQLTYPDGAELLVLAGDFCDAGDHLHAMSWMRLPRGGRLAALAGSQGARVWIKQGHLRFIDLPIVL
ncbi:cupin domain-containing protein [Massilia soli]|uniref:Cupin domain-containing protein n=1 Tax=Massilia soli TaxID=2792854 RepID=A0ABS7SK76_9BURK|nr:cupin domain-containing protein [Massilia soli]MBZ2206601.1 cupin domain-containing protein [Massilia soli]